MAPGNTGASAGSSRHSRTSIYGWLNRGSSESAVTNRAPCSSVFASPMQELVHVVVVELRTIACAGAGQRFVELLQGILATFRMREVGREHEDPGPRLLHHPIHRFPGERGELEMAAHV